MKCLVIRDFKVQKNSQNDSKIVKKTVLVQNGPLKKLPIGVRCVIYQFLPTHKIVTEIIWNSKSERAYICETKIIENERILKVNEHNVIHITPMFECYLKISTLINLKINVNKFD